MKMFGARSHCRCVFPFIKHPGKCSKCELSHYDAERMRLRAIEIPFRFFAAGDISWQQQEHLVESIDRIVWSTFNQLKHTVIGERSLLTYFQESILEQVSELLQQRHGLQLLPQDEANYKSEDICDLMSQLKLND